MPEGDVLKLTAERLGAALGGAPLVRAELRWPGIAGADLCGRTLRESVAYGKHTLLRFDDGRTLHTHLRMDGSWQVRRTGARDAAGRSPAVRAVLATETWTCLGWHLGMMDLVRTRDEGMLIGHLGPDVLAPDFVGAPATDGRFDDGAAEGTRRLAVDPARPVCVALLDQRTVAGLGTIWTAESLFAERLWPWTAVGELPTGRVRALLLTAARLVRGSVAVGRRQGLGAVERRVHGRHHRPCVRCGTPIALGSTAGPDVRPDQGALERVVYWCPVCQRT
ncbi:DNA glycosylase/AP lyase, H2TH DNA-binding protein [Xylanimonas cellulosilytica DSM 15894]|uniref:DNA-(apurinic or apyrimidinic site) lyase n=1 Tax=Xylanimonas cellulosilytica (strain DSM 15894 / JCM 12276 / CECT 5975 / KCTC 9989 / LMG 20990 / NBRC 107835 / XIL07) TaxID=446471 RepID=D1C081_XYLCX|nr:DNA-formamidopyrimidine glycosylase family protein [Xylanimonas cellulosilytica]ACZ30270.1 DNA glycosylase/AP lyase, H2TH DNA-binding protein [Xylanimonas cellulosilytica DSM 15894]